MKTGSKNFILLLILASLWGPSFLFIKIAVREISPIHLAALRIAVAAITLNIILLISGKPFKKTLNFWKHIVISGFFSMSLPFALICWGEMYIDSALASIINGLTPLFTIIVANFIVPDDKMTKQKLIGTIIGFTGLLVLISPHFSTDMQASTWGVIAVTLAAGSYGLGMIYARLKLKETPPLHAPASQLLASAIYMIPLAIMMDGVPGFASFSLNAMGSVLILAIFGTAIAYTVYFKIIENASASYLSYVTYLIPIYGIVLGIIFLNESIDGESITGAIIILLGLMIANKTIKLPFRKKYGFLKP